MADWVAVRCLTKNCPSEGRIPSGSTFAEAGDALRAAGWHCTDGTWRCLDCWNKWQAGLTRKIHNQAEMVKREREKQRESVS